ncbi:MAG: hypothetical protein M1828_000713 [Chrysothrix sp. TS-e1954]|nr:MAG: hypothetical protein M1828_000713 [Chrysothrix sp. TS-e1954]
MAHNHLVLLVFIHGFKGDDSTFASFPKHITRILNSSATESTSLQYRHLVYPRFDTRGSLELAVSSFRDWLLNKVIDLEVELGTAHPMVEPGVQTVICGHSMGGIVAVEAVRGLVADLSSEKTSEGKAKQAMFPLVKGVLAFDTPYLGVAPGVVKYGAEEQWTQGKAWYQQAQGIFGGSSKGGSEGATPPSPPPKDTDKALPPIPNGPKWKTYAKPALFATAATAALAGAGTAAYFGRNHITSGVSWATSHLEFVGCLYKVEELKQRLAAAVAMEKEWGVGFRNMYTLLGKDKGEKRTFCSLPKSKGAMSDAWIPALNEKVGGEVEAHLAMFTPKENPQFDMMSETAKDIITTWTQPPDTLGTAPVGETLDGEVETDETEAVQSAAPTLAKDNAVSTTDVDPAEQDISDIAMHDVADHADSSDALDSPPLTQEAQHDHAAQESSNNNNNVELQADAPA